MPRTRRTSRLLIRRHSRRVTRPHVRPFKREPDHLGQTITCYRRAIRAYRRLAKLAPHHYDTTLIEREARRREEELQWRASWEPELEKFYGPPTPAEREAELRADWLAAQPPRLHPSTRRAVDRQLAAYELWKEAGQLAFRRYEDFQRRRPHDVPTLGRVVQIIEIAFDFGWIATGRDWRNPEPDPEPGPSREEEFEAAIRRIYGESDSSSVNPHQPSTTDHQSTNNNQPSTEAPTAPTSAPDSSLPVPTHPAPAPSSPLPAFSPPSADPLEIPASPSADDTQPSANPGLAPSSPLSASPPPQPASEPPPVPNVGRRDAYASFARHQRALVNRGPNS